MCILFVAVRCHPAFPFIFAHNRDEYRARPSCTVSLESETGVACGRDAEAGGTVLGINSLRGHFAALTNRSCHRELPSSRTSRGRLVEHILLHGPDSVKAFVSSRVFDGFHLVFGDILTEDPRLEYIWCEAPASGSESAPSAAGSEEVNHGIFVLSNENVSEGEPPWPKSVWLRTAVSSFLEALPSDPLVHDVQEGLAEIMGHADAPPPGQEVSSRSSIPDKRSGPFLRWHENLQDFGTVSQSVMISDVRSRELHYFHRSTNLPRQDDTLGPPLAGLWEQLLIPWSPSSNI